MFLLSRVHVPTPIPRPLRALLPMFFPQFYENISGCGWPAFDKCFKGAVVTQTDNAYGMRRVEIMCGKCGGHLGHVFEGERMTATNERHCVNSISVKFQKGAIPEGLEEEKVV